MNILTMDPTILDAWLEQEMSSPCWECEDDCLNCTYYWEVMSWLDEPTPYPDHDDRREAYYQAGQYPPGPIH